MSPGCWQCLCHVRSQGTSTAWPREGPGAAGLALRTSRASSAMGTNCWSGKPAGENGENGENIPPPPQQNPQVPGWPHSWIGDQQLDLLLEAFPALTPRFHEKGALGSQDCPRETLQRVKHCSMPSPGLQPCHWLEFTPLPWDSRSGHLGPSPSC